MKGFPKSVFKKSVSITMAAAVFVGLLGAPSGRLEAAVTPEEALRQQVSALIADQEDESACDNSKQCASQRGSFDRLSLSRQWEEILGVFQYVQGHPESFSPDLVSSINAYLGMVEGLKAQMEELGYAVSNSASSSVITAGASGPSLNGQSLGASGMTVEEKSSLMRLIFKDAALGAVQAAQNLPSGSLQGLGGKNPFVKSDISDGPPNRGPEKVDGVETDRETGVPPTNPKYDSGGGGDWGKDDTGEWVTDLATAAGIGVAVGVGVAAGAVATAVALTVGVVIVAIVNVVKDESPDQISVSPELRLALAPMVQQLLQHPQGGVKGGQVDPIAMKDTATTVDGNAATKPVVSAQQKAQLLNQAKFGSGFVAPVSSRNGGGGLPTEVGGKVGSPVFGNSGQPATTGCVAGRLCR